MLAYIGVAYARELHVDKKLVVSHLIQNNILEHEVLLGIVHNIGNCLDVSRRSVRHLASR